MACKARHFQYTIKKDSVSLEKLSLVEKNNVDSLNRIIYLQKDKQLFVHHYLYDQEQLLNLIKFCPK